MLPFYLLCAHITGDFILQNDYMAAHKKSSSWVCSLHVLVYLLPFSLLAFCGQISWLVVVLIGMQHWIQDRTSFVAWWMRVSRQTKFAQPPFAPWSSIIVDGGFHLIAISTIVACS